MEIELMTKQEHIQKIKETIDTEGNPSRVTLDMIEQALRELPHEPDLWCWRGDVLQRVETDDYPDSSITDSYHRAIAVDPLSYEGYESLGYYFDVFENDPKKAESWFRKALELSDSVDSFVGLDGGDAGS